MTTAIKWLIGGGVAAALAYGLTRGAKLISDKFSYAITGYGTPSLNTSTWLLTLPIKLQFNNPSPVDINVDKLAGNIYIWRNSFGINPQGQFVPIGKIDQPITIAPGTSNVALNAQVNLKDFAQYHLLTTGVSFLLTKQIRLRTDLVATYGKFTLPASPFDKTISV
jgi:hypothetical protein